jgi:TatD DNase family protein
MFVDIHTHKFSNPNFPAILNLLFEEAQLLFASNEKGFFSLGFHPWKADEFTIKAFAILENWAKDSRCFAIGECGLDKNSEVSLAQQMFVFEKQIELAERMQKPLIIHCVDCFNELAALKRKWKPEQLWIIHGFRGKPQLAIQALKLGCALSFGEHFNAESVRATPFDKLFVETDDSLLSIDQIYALISGAKNCRPNDLMAGDCLIRAIRV